MASANLKDGVHGLRLRGICKAYGKEQVLRELDLELVSGQVALLLGQNGSGKSTLLRIAAGLCRPEKGTIEFSGRVGYFGHQSLLYSALTVRENLKLTADLTKTGPDIDTVIEEWNLRDCASKSVVELSKGQQSRAALARAFIQSTGLLLLDEPTSALDEVSTALLCQKLKGTASAVLIATHDVFRLEAHAQRALVISDGRLKHDSSNGLAVAKVIDSYREINR